MFTLAISCLTTSNLPWFMDLTFQVPMQYCSLQHQTLLLSPVTSTAGYSFCFGSIPSFFLELFLHWSSVAYWAPTDLGSFSFSILSFCLFILFMGFSRQEYWSGLLFPSPVELLLELSTMTCPSWAALLGMAHSFIELDKAVIHVIRFVSFLWLCFLFCLMEKGKRLMEASWWEKLIKRVTESQMVKRLSINVGDLGPIHGSVRFPGEGNGSPLQYSCLENPMDWGAWCRLLSMGLQRVRQFSSVTQSCPTLCDLMNCSTPGLPVHHQLPECTQTHVHRVSDDIQPSHPLSSPSPLAPNPSQQQSLFQWVNSLYEVAKVLEFQL